MRAKIQFDFPPLVLLRHIYNFLQGSQCKDPVPRTQDNEQNLTSSPPQWNSEIEFAIDLQPTRCSLGKAPRVVACLEME